MEQNKKLSLSALIAELPQPLNVFLCCASFESRCRSVADAIDARSPRKTIVARNGSIAEVIGNNTDYLVSRFPITSVADIDPSDPVSNEDHLLEALSWALSESPSNVLVDITTFTRETLLILLKLLRRTLKPADTVMLAYVGATKYSLDQEKPESVWLSRGVREIRSILGFPGMVQPSRRTHLILLAGFESERAISLINAYEPALLSLGYGPLESSINEEHHKLNVMFHEKVAALYGDVHRFEFPPNDPLGTKDAILHQAEKFPNANIVVGALNTKLSTVGAGLAAFENPALQLCYAEADIYNFANYSVPATECYLFESASLRDPVS